MLESKIEEANIPELPYEKLIEKVFGIQWRTLPEADINGALGVAIVKSVLDGLPPELGEISSHLGVNKETLREPYKNLNMNGIFRRNRIQEDALALNNEDLFAWSYYAAYAAGIIGPWLPKKK